ncbi:hypothetical protein [Actinomyces bowdenii]|uniref:Uncharacterized protein n=1 Tax=Actinomyces bowdenii TaxID=131109 RepID=A0A853EIX3_9ACTO|nr:hypothetical protein [Actinomyces bowdenii]MBF0696337.1 hypothetical protein [Actinomyces bowdenii]NYS68510.1 hypothetical protein [Actinomyces bowdenii]
MVDQTSGAPGDDASPETSRRFTWVQVLQGVQCGALLAAAVMIRSALPGADGAVLVLLSLFLIARVAFSGKASAANRAAYDTEKVPVPSRAAILILGLADLVVVGHLLLMRQKGLEATGFGNDSLLAQAVLIISVGTALTCRLLEHRADPPRNHALLVAGGFRRSLSRLRAWAAHTALLAAAALAAVALILAPTVVRVATSPVTAHLADGVPAPAAEEFPQSVAGEVAWMRDVALARSHPFLRDVLPGAAGPILVQKSVVSCLSTEDGSTRWSVERTGSAIETAMISPDGKSLVVVYQGPASQGNARSDLLVIVFDAISGRQITHEDLPAANVDSGTGIQVTDHVVLIGGQAISLKDGSTLWSVPDVENHAWRTVGSSTLVTQVQCTQVPSVDRLEADGPEAGLPRELCDLTLMDDQDPSRVRTVTNVVADEWNGDSIVLVRGWTVRVVDGAAADELATADLEAVNIDDAATWPIGDSAGPFDERTQGEWLRGEASMILLRPPVRDGAQDSDASLPDRILDPSTGTITPITAEVDSARSRGYPTANLTTATASGETPTVTVTRNGEGPPIVLDLPTAGPAHGQAMLQAVPGGVLLVVALPSEEERVVVYFLR